MIDLTKKEPLQKAITIRDMTIDINCDYRTWMRFVTEYEKWVSDGCKGRLDIEYLFKYVAPIFESPEDYNGILEFAFPKSVVPHIASDNSEPVLFYDIDGDYIYAAFMQQYGIDLICSDMHWHQFKALLNAITAPTKLYEIMGYRSYTGDKVDEKQIRRRLKEAWLPPVCESEEEKEAEERFNQYFN